MKVAVFLGLLGAALLPSAVHAQNVNRTVDVQPGTVLTISQNGQRVMSQHVQPGRVHIQITYLSATPGRRRR